MAYSVELKDQQLLVILSLDDALEAVGEYAGEELKRYLASYYEVNLADGDDYEKILDQMVQDAEMRREQHRHRYHSWESELHWWLREWLFYLLEKRRRTSKRYNEDFGRKSRCVFNLWSDGCKCKW